MLSAAVAAVAGSCAADSATQLVVHVDSNFDVPTEMSDFWATVRTTDGVAVAEHNFKLVGPQDRVSGGLHRLPASFGVSPPEGDPSRSVIIEVDAIGPGSAVLFTRRAVTSFVGGKRLLVPMFLARGCEERSCPVGQTCTELGCRRMEIEAASLQEILPGEDPVWDGGVSSLPSDAGPAAAEDAGPTDSADTGARPDTGPALDSGVEGPVPCSVGEVYAKSCWPVVPSNVTECYNDTSPITCPGRGGSSSCGTTRYCGQDAQYPDGDGRVFTCVDGGGVDLMACASTATTGETVRDSLTRLIWQRAALPDAMPWQAAVDYCANLTYGGESDWQLPGVHELKSIVDDSRAAPAADAQVFPGTQSGDYWTSSPYVPNPDSAWRIQFVDGRVGFSRVASAGWVRCVRRPDGAGPASGRFIESSVGGDALVADGLTGLMWQGTVASARRWSDALGYCESLTHGGFSDWRLPRKKTLESLVDFERTDPASAFPNMISAAFWSSSTAIRNSIDAWPVGFSTGGGSSSGKALSFAVRCVR